MTRKHAARPWFNLGRHNDPPANPPAPPANPPANPTANPPTPPVDPANQPLGEPGLKALQAEREARAAAEAELSRLKNAEAERLLKEKSELEQAQQRQANAEKAAAEAISRAAQAEIRAMADGFADREDAVLNLGDLSKYIKDGQTDVTAIQAALTDVLARKPHLAKAQTPTGPRLPGPDPSQGQGGTGQPGTTDFRKADQATVDAELAKYGIRTYR